MNAKLLEYMIRYRDTYDLAMTKTILSQKIFYQYAIVQEKQEGKVYREQLASQINVQSAMLVEARAARRYWSLYKKRLGNKIVWVGRVPHGKDCANTLLDIGYHYLTHYLVKICEEINIPTELGFFHKAQSKNAHPFAYDFMEWFRPIVVDQVLLKVVSRKKNKIEVVDEKLIKYFLGAVKRKLNTYLYHRKLKYCLQFDYWIHLMLLEFVSAVYENKEYKPLFPSLRHESRCKKPPKAVKKIRR